MNIGPKLLSGHGWNETLRGKHGRGKHGEENIEEKIMEVRYLIF